MCSLSLAGTGGPFGVAWCLRPLWRRRQRRVGCAPCAPSGELLLFRRSCLCRSLCAASGDLCLFLLSRGAVFCARCVAALAAAVARCVCPWRFRCADVGSFWPALCVAVVLPTSATCGCVLRASSVRPAVSCCAPVVSYLRPLVPLMCQLRWFCSRCFVVDWPGSPGVSEAAAGVTEGPSRALFIRLAVSRCGITSLPDGERRPRFQPFRSISRRGLRRDSQSLQKGVEPRTPQQKT